MTEKVINDLPVRQEVPGVGAAGPGEALEAPAEVARQLVAGGTWRRPKPKKETRGDAAPASKED